MSNLNRKITANKTNRFTLCTSFSINPWFSSCFKALMWMTYFSLSSILQTSFSSFSFFSLVKIGSLYENQIIFLDTLLHIFICHLIRIILNGQLFIVKLYGQVVYVHLKKILLITLKRWKLGFPNEATLTRLLKMKWKKYFLWEQK